MGQQRAVDILDTRRSCTALRPGLLARYHHSTLWEDTELIGGIGIGNQKAR